MRRILLLAVCLVVVTATQIAGQNTAGLDALAKSSGPFVFSLDTPTQLPANPQSLTQLGSALGLKVFDQDGISVLSTPERFDPSALFDGRIQQPKSLVALYLDLLASLDQGQLRMMGSSQGLTYSMLSEDQQAIMSLLFAPPRTILRADEAIPAESLPIASVRLHGWMELRSVDIRSCPLEDQWSKGNPVIDVSIANPNLDSWKLAEPKAPADKEGRQPIPPDAIKPGLPVPNTLKSSDLDYSLPDLQKPMPIQGMVSLKSLIETVVRETGLKLTACPGSDKVMVYVSSSGIPAGRLLKAIALATCCTWRALGDTYMFAVDRIGIAQIATQMRDLRGDPDMAAMSLAMSWFSAGSQLNPMYYLPLRSDSEFALSPDQMKMLVADSTSMDLHGLEWNQLSQEQQAIIGAKAESRVGVGGEAFPLLKSDPSQWRVMPHLRIRLAFSFPSIGRVEPSDSISRQIMQVFPPDDQLQLLGGFWSDIPQDHKVSLNKPVRACIHKPSRSDTPSKLIAAFVDHGFNTLLLRVFADGYTAFPSKQFPMRKGLDADYLQTMISVAHSRGMKVFGVVDVLRWSDGSRDHWVVKKTDLLDRDIYGRTHSEWARSRDTNAFEDCIMGFVFGEGITGDAVSPFCPQVSSMLSSLVDELAAYDLDGLALDYVTMVHRDDGPGFEGMAAGSPGHHPLARAAFLAAFHADSIDAAVGRAYDLTLLPAQPIVQACAGLDTSWQRQYASKATELMAGLARKWSDAHQGSHVWVMDSLLTEPDSLDWLRLKGLAAAILVPAMMFHAPIPDIPSYPLIRATERMGTVLFYGLLAKGLGYKVEKVFEGMGGDPWKTDGLAVDFTTAGRKKNDYLRIIEPPKSGNITGQQSP